MIHAVLHRIFRFVDRPLLLPGVCRSWRGACASWSSARLDLRESTPEEVDALLRRFPRALEVNLGSHCRALSRVGARCRSLSCADALTDAALDGLAARFPDLCALSIRGCPRLTGLGALSGLSSLDLAGCDLSDATALALCRGNPNLTALDLGGFRGACGIVAAHRGLVSLGLRDSAATDADVAALSGLTALTALDLGGCGRLTNAAARSLADGCPALASLSLRESPEVSDLGLRALAAGCPGLTSLDLSSCARVSNAGLRCLADGCPALATLWLAGCDVVSDWGIQRIAAGCPRLGELHVGAVGEETLHLLAAGCPGLRTLELESVRHARAPRARRGAGAAGSGTSSPPPAPGARASPRSHCPPSPASA